MVLGVQVNLEEPVILCARIRCRDCFQIRLEPAQRPTEPQPGAPAGRLGTQPGQVPTDGVDGLLDDDPRLRDRQRMSKEQRRRLLKNAAAPRAPRLSDAAPAAVRYQTYPAEPARVPPIRRTR